MSREIPWNYTKFLVSGDGQKVRYFNPREDPLKLRPFIDKFLANASPSEAEVFAANNDASQFENKPVASEAANKEEEVVKTAAIRPMISI